MTTLPNTHNVSINKGALEMTARSGQLTVCYRMTTTARFYNIKEFRLPADLG
jgi:hypothetical protein